ncbi:MAG: hypothetical protein ACI9NT_001339, partial [Bacteroidia bacterium]
MKYPQFLKVGLAVVICLAVSHCSDAPETYWPMWEIDTHGSGADGVHIGDINRDGWVDVVSGWEESGDLMLYLNPGPTHVRSAAAWAGIEISGGVTVEGIEDAAFADLDLDGSYDAVISSNEGANQSLGIHWLHGGDTNKAENWRGANLTPSKHSGYMKARAAQIDGVDGADIVAGTRILDGKQAGIYWFKAPGGTHPGNVEQWQRFYIGPVDIKTVTLVIKDMDGDALPDIVFSGRNGIGWYRNPGYQALAQLPADAVWERIIIAERGSEFTFCDHIIDGMEDIIVATSHDSGMVAKWLKRLDASGRHWVEYPIKSDTLRARESFIGKFVLKGVACGYVNDDEHIDVVFSASGHGHGIFMMTPRADIASGLNWDLVNLIPYANY